MNSLTGIPLLFPILGETGCRLAEIVGLRIEDFDLDDRVLHIRPNDKRRLKTAGSERSLPLNHTANYGSGYALEVIREHMVRVWEE